MKRAIFILFGLVLALVLFDKVLKRKRAAKYETANPASNNAVDSHAFSRSESRTFEPLQISPTDSSSTNEDEDDGDEWEKLSREQVEAYLLKTKRSPESLLNAFQETGDTNYLAEAVEKHSDNPLVQWTMIYKGPPEERAGWLEKLKTSSPDNALPNYLLALDKLKAGNAEQALAEIDAASNKSGVSSFDRERMQSREEMYLLAGYSALDAKYQGMAIGLPNLPELKSLAQEISLLQQKYKAAEDDSSAQELAAIGIEAASKVGDGRSSPSLINRLVGNAMENIALNNLGAETYYDFLGKTAGERIQEIRNEKQEVRNLAPAYTELYPHLTDAEKMIYLDRLKLYGELNALRWLKKNYGTETK